LQTIQCMLQFASLRKDAMRFCVSEQRNAAKNGNTEVALKQRKLQRSTSQQTWRMQTVISCRVDRGDFVVSHSGTFYGDLLQFQQITLG